MAGEKTITVRDIAKEAKVSVATVSRVLNHSDRVTDKTRQKVQRVIDKHEFKPNALARSLYKKRTKVIGCILPDITSHYFAKMFLELERSAHEAGYTMFLCNSMNDTALESVYIEKLIEQQVDGVILMGGRTNDIHQDAKEVAEIKALATHCPTVIINGIIDDDHVRMINTDEAFAVDRMVKYLVDKGHRSMAMVGGFEHISVSKAKMDAFLEACDKYGLEDDARFTRYSGFNPEDGRAVTEAIHQAGKMPEAIIAMNDTVAIGILDACRDLGIRVPEDLSVMGYDNVDISDISHPKLTTFAHAYETIGKITIDTIDTLIEDGVAVHQQLVRGEIVERLSVQSR